MKDSGMRIRVEQQLREDFLAACKNDDVPAAQVIRQFMKKYIEKATKQSGVVVRSKRTTTGKPNHA
jgi:hypothetical protein